MARPDRRYLSQTDLLLHLVTHAVYTHQLNNGPLVLCDIHYLAGSDGVDWKLFWSRARAGGWTRGCQLLLRMTERWLGALSCAWEGVPRPPVETDTLVAGCAALMFRDWTAVSDERLVGALDGKSLAQRARVLLGKMFPSRAHLAMLYPVPADSAAIYPLVRAACGPPRHQAHPRGHSWAR